MAPSFSQDAFGADAETTFLFSSKDHVPEQFFQGYFFHGTDYVFGQSGFDAFSHRRGVTRLSREDGCYVQVEKRNDRFRFAADYGGFKKIFYFWNAGFWVVSNSLQRIVGHLRQNGYPVRPNVAQLAAAATEGTFYPSGRGSFFSQMATFDTIVQGVRCVPMDCTLWIGSSGVQLEKDDSSHPAGDYREHLTRFIDTWTARLKTVMNEPSARIVCDLSGGLDSRVVFALLLDAIGESRFGSGRRLRIRTSEQPDARRDKSVAARLCAHAGLPLNGFLKRGPKRLSGDSSYALWRDLCLGVYHPIYFPYSAISPGVVYLTGGGGENHRPFYGQFLGAPSAGSLVSTRARNIVRRAARTEFGAALERAVRTILDDAPGCHDVLAAHYRHFRNRFHTGREPQYTVTLPPLASRLLDTCTAVAGERRFGTAQMLYDVIFNVHPDMLDIPFDKLRKRPGRAVRRNFTSIGRAVGMPAGGCFIGNAPAAAGSRSDAPRAVDFLREDFARAKAGFAADFLGSAYIRRAQRALDAAMHTNGFSGPVASKRVAVVLAAGMFDT